MKKRATIIVTIILAVLVLAPLILPAILPWSKINRKHEEISIVTGQMRITRHVWFLPVSCQIRDTYLSKTYTVSDVSAGNQWYAVNTSSPWWRHSPHYAFHSALAQVKQLELILEMNNASRDQCVAAMKGLLSAWQESGDDSQAQIYITELSTKLEQAAR